MTKGQFDRAFQRLSKQRQKVLELFLGGMRDREIAQTLHITGGTVRSHIRDIRKHFGLENEFPDDRSSQRDDLTDLFRKYKPELLGEPVAPEEAERPSAIDPEFVGRGDAMRDLDNLVNRRAKCILILSPGGQGKTTLAWQYLKNRFSPEEILYFPIAKETKDVASVESLVEEQLRKLGEEPGREFMVSLNRLREKLTEKPMGVLIDNLEPALDESNCFVSQHRSYVELFKQVLLSSQVQAITIITSRAPLNEGLNVALYPLEPLNVAAWQAYFEHWEIVTDTTVLKEMHEFYNGNALAMGVLCSAVRNDFQGDCAAYWADCKTEDGLLVEERIENLIEEQFKSLEQLRPDAYNLLCRMGCYRYQDVPTVLKEGLLCLLWDVQKLERQRVVRILRDCALVNFVQGEYSLHPVIRAEALKRLRDGENWEQANRVAAEFWTNSVKTIETAENAIRAFEAYYHYRSINNFVQCCEVIVTIREGKIWGKLETLGRAFYRLGLFDKMTSSIFQIDRFYELKKSQYGGEIFNVLGAIYWLQGNLMQAITYYNIGKDLAIKHKNTEIILNSLLNLSLCKLDLWEIAEAENLLEKYRELSEKNKCYEHFQISSFCLGLIHSILGEIKKTDCLLKNFNIESQIEYTPWSRGYALLFSGFTQKNINRIEKSFILFNKAIAFAEIEYYYPQVKAKALTGLAELYRIENDFSKSLSHHHESIQILERIGAKCDLAEAYYQLALTQQKMGNLESETYFNKAIELWTEIDAPKQIERIRNSMNNLADSF